MKDTRKYIIYARKSTEDEEKQMQSIKSQLDFLRKKAKAEGLNVIAELQEAKSAKRPFMREQFDHLIEHIESGEADGILTWEINRLSRNPTESGILQQLLQDEKILSIKTQGREYLPEDNAIILSVETSMSNQFVRDLKVSVKRGMNDKVRHGGLIGPAPEGYLNDRLEKTVYKDPLRFPLIRKAFDMYLAGSSVQQIRRYLNDQCGYRTVERKKVGGNPLSTAALYYILANPRYAGRIPDPYTDEFYDAKYPAMITEDEYNQVRLLLGSKGKPRYVQGKYFALKGLLKCGECGCAITAEEHSKKLATGEMKKYTYYHCTKKKPCSQKAHITEDILFEKLDMLLGEYEISPQLYQWGMEAIADIAKKESHKQISIQGMQTLSIEAVQSQLNNLLGLATKGFITAEEYGTQSKPLKDELSRLQIEHNNALTRARNWYEAVSKTIEMLDGARGKFAKGDILAKKQILLAIGSNPKLKDGEISIDTYKWLIPIKKQTPALLEQLNKVRNASQQIKNSVNEAVFQQWYPGLELNQRP